MVQTGAYSRAGALDWVPSRSLELCSGACGPRLFRGRFGELPQLDRGFVDSNTTMVTVSIGGNDSGFIPVLMSCVSPTPCAPTDPNADPTRAKIVGPVRSSLMTVLSEIRRKAPHARIFLMGYPHLVEGDGKTPMCLPFVYNTEAAYMNKMTDLLARTEEEVVDEFNRQRGRRVAFYVDPRPDFEGHEACTGTPYIRGYELEKTPGENPSNDPLSGGRPASQQTLHPNIDGAAAYSRSFERALRAGRP